MQFQLVVGNAGRRIAVDIHQFVKHGGLRHVEGVEQLGQFRIFVVQRALSVGVQRDCASQESAIVGAPNSLEALVNIGFLEMIPAP